MYGANPYISSAKGITPAMATSNVYLRAYLKKAERAYSILKFLYDSNKHSELLMRMREALVSSNAEQSQYMYIIYNLFGMYNQLPMKKRLGLYNIVKSAQKKLNEKS